MKSKFLKIAGVKSDKAFYKKYPTEAAFFKAHPEAKKEIKKAQFGASFMSSFAQNMQNLPNMQNMMQGQMQSPGVNAGMFQSGNQQSVGGPMNAPGSYNSYDIDNNGINDIMQGPQNNPLNSEPIDYNKQYMNMSLADEKLKKPKAGVLDQLSKMGGPAGQIIGGIQAIKEGKKKRKEAEMWANVSNVQAQAAESTDIDAFRQYTENAERKRNAFMPVTTGEEFFPVYGTGTNVLRSSRNGAKLEDGGMVGGNPTEIQNTYGDGNSLYDDLEYEPLYNIDQIKSYRMGGYLPKAFDGAAMSGMMSSMGGGAGGGTPWGAIGGLGSQAAGSLTGNDGGGQVGGAIGGVAGSFFGPAGQAIGQTVGTLAGGLLDTNDRDQRKAEAKTKYNMDRMITSQFTTDYLHPRFGSNMRDGGYMNPEYNPQVITMFGDVNDEDFADYANKDQYRAGGHIRGGYRQPNERAFNQSAENGTALDGSLEPMWGGTIKDVSYNPYIGNMAMGFGNDHDESDGNGNTGIGMKVLDDGGEVTGEVEIETKEPMINTGDSVTVLGARTIPKQLKLDFNIKKGTTFKKAGEEIGKQDNKINKQKEKLVEEYLKLNPITSFDKLEQDSKEMMIKGLEAKQKINAEMLMGLSSYQNNSEELSNSLGYEDVNKFDKDLEKGKINQSSIMKNAKFGTSVPKAQYGLEVWEGNKTGLGKKTASEFTLDQWNQIAKKYGFKGQGNKEFQKFLMSNPETANIIKARHNILYGANPETNPELYDDLLGRGYAAAELLDIPKKTTPEERKNTINKNDGDASFETIPYKRSGLLDFAGQLLPYIRPTDQEELNPNQLMGEMYAMSSNQLEPVQAIPVSPRLRVPYEINRNAAKNDLISQTRAAQRSAGYNPALQAYIASQAYSPMQQLNEQDFIDNQRMKDTIFSGNIDTLNDADTKNRQIYYEQYLRQSQAKSNTKAIAQAALNSISDKYSKNALENRTLGVMENMYNYRFDNAGRAINMNAPFQANIPYIYGNDGKPTHKIVYDKSGKNIIGYQPVSKKDATKIPSGATPAINPDTSMISQDVAASEEYSPIDENNIMYQERNGGKIKKKKYSQSSIVRAFK